MKKLIAKLFLKYCKEDIWKMSGDIAERTFEKDSGDFDILRERMEYWITSGIKNIK